MILALYQKFPSILDRNLAKKANCTEDHVCTSCDKVVLGACSNRICLNEGIFFVSDDHMLQEDTAGTLQDYFSFINAILPN